jgi:hypothetical protein
MDGSFHAFLLTVGLEFGAPHDPRNSIPSPRIPRGKPTADRRGIRGAVGNDRQAGKDGRSEDMKAPLNTPSHLWLPATRDETAPRGPAIRAAIDAETRRWINRSGYCGRSYIKSGTVKPDDLAFEIGAYRGR